MQKDFSKLGTVVDDASAAFIRAANHFAFLVQSLLATYWADDLVVFGSSRWRFDWRVQKRPGVVHFPD
jgi:hypothetical protein